MLHANTHLSNNPSARAKTILQIYLYVCMYVCMFVCMYVDLPEIRMNCTVQDKVNGKINNLEQIC